MISAVASDAAGNQTTAFDVTVNILNTQQAPSGLVAAFGFNEGSGAMAADASGQGNGGTLVNAIWTAGKFGNALSFNGSNAWVTVADALSLRLTGGLTLEAWVRPSSGAGWRTVLLKEAGSGLAYALYSANGASRPAGYGRTPVETVVTGTAAVSTTAWTHLALTFDGTTMRLFVNGTQVRSATATGPIAALNGDLRIGGNSVWGEYFAGLIDEVRVYRPRTDGGRDSDGHGDADPIGVSSDHHASGQPIQRVGAARPGVDWLSSAASGYVSTHNQPRRHARRFQAIDAEA